MNQHQSDASLSQEGQQPLLDIDERLAASLLTASAGAVVFAGGVAGTIDRWPPPKVRSPREAGDRR